MGELRFATARALFDSFTMANSRISVPPTDEPALDFLRGLVSQDKLDDAVSFCAYLLGRRECVWWGCRSVRRLLDPIPPAQMPPPRPTRTPPPHGTPCLQRGQAAPCRPDAASRSRHRPS